ncbi:MAG: hypothetical protein CL931_16200 [Deltaproteobacteria bacterium]|nr:hypothetical protein [Deltaproteobacteria bacterium]
MKTKILNKWLAGLRTLLPLWLLRDEIQTAGMLNSAEDARERRAREILNRFHPALVEALFSESTGRAGPGARVHTVERQGLVLIGPDRTLCRVGFQDVSPEATNVFDAILRLIRNIACFSYESDAEESVSELSRLMMPGASMNRR